LKRNTLPVRADIAIKKGKCQMNPIGARPVDELQMVSRKVFCKSYAECLNLALSRGWQSFSCGSCGDFGPEERSVLEWNEDAQGCGDLLSVVFGLRIMPLGIFEEP
jgi:hypothetical protein